MRGPREGKKELRRQLPARVWSYAQTVPTGDPVSCHRRTKDPQSRHGVSHPGRPESSRLGFLNQPDRGRRIKHRNNEPATFTQSGLTARPATAPPTGPQRPLHLQGK